jgi:dipeptidyl aminopeptidase/acylaminoacyl peptidase
VAVSYSYCVFNHRPVPLELVLSGRDVTEPKLSPSGETVAVVQHWRGHSAIVEVDVQSRFADRVITFGADPAPGRGFSGGCFSWLPTGDGLVYVGVDGELWRIAGTDTGRLTEHGRKCRGPVVRETLGSETQILAYVLDEAEVWVTDLGSGLSRRLDDGHHAFCFDPAVSPDGTTVSWMGWSPPAMAWDAADRVDCRLDDGYITQWRPQNGALQQPRFALDGTPMCVHDGSGWLNVYVGGKAVSPEAFEQAGPTWGMGQRSYVDRGNGSVVFTRNDRGFGSICMSDDRGEIQDMSAGFIGVLGQLSTAGDHVAALRSGPTTPPEVVVFATDGGPGRMNIRHRLAGGGVRAWTEVQIPDPEPVSMTHEGVTLHARRYRAAGGEEFGARVLCWIHGGPTDQWQVDFRPRIVHWVSRGWDVLVVDPRGSTGHGRAFQQSLNGAWGRLDVDDAAALVRHVHVEGWATPETTVAIGGSAGGLTVLGLLADYPGIVAGGVAAYPVSDLVDLAHTDYRFEAHYTETLVGPMTDRDLYQSLSPLNRADQIAGPLLLFHGADDPVVPVAQTELLAERIRSTGGDVECVIYEGEGHGFRHPDNQRDEYERTERFLDRVTSTA